MPHADLGVLELGPLEPLAGRGRARRSAALAPAAQVVEPPGDGWPGPRRLAVAPVSDVDAAPLERGQAASSHVRRPGDRRGRCGSSTSAVARAALRPLGAVAAEAVLDLGLAAGQHGPALVQAGRPGPRARYAGRGRRPRAARAVPRAARAAAGGSSPAASSASSAGSSAAELGDAGLVGGQPAGQLGELGPHAVASAVLSRSRRPARSRSVRAVRAARGGCVPALGRPRRPRATAAVGGAPRPRPRPRRRPCRLGLAPPWCRASSSATPGAPRPRCARAASPWPRSDRRRGSRPPASGCGEGDVEAPRPRRRATPHGRGRGARRGARSTPGVGERTWPRSGLARASRRAGAGRPESAPAPEGQDRPARPAPWTPASRARAASTPVDDHGGRSLGRHAASNAASQPGSTSTTSRRVPTTPSRPASRSAPAAGPAPRRAASGQRLGPGRPRPVLPAGGRFDVDSALGRLERRPRPRRPMPSVAWTSAAARPLARCCAASTSACRRAASASEARRPGASSAASRTSSRRRLGPAPLGAGPQRGRARPDLGRTGGPGPRRRQLGRASGRRRAASLRRPRRRCGARARPRPRPRRARPPASAASASRLATTSASISPDGARSRDRRRSADQRGQAPGPLAQPLARRRQGVAPGRVARGATRQLRRGRGRLGVEHSARARSDRAPRRSAEARSGPWRRPAGAPRQRGQLTAGEEQPQRPAAR